jgi:hypothetical protein
MTQEQIKNAADGRPDMIVMINPGTTPVERAQERLAHSNMRRFLADLGRGVTARRVSEGEEDGSGGRWMFRLERGKRHVLVHMPGCPRDMVCAPLRAGMVLPYRLYVDGNSWMWPYALNIARDALGIGRPT